MSRYNGNNGGSSNGDNDYDDNKTIKLQNYAAVRLTPKDASANEHDQFGTSIIFNFEAAEVLDGVVFERDDKPGTWKVFSAGKFFNLNPEDGLVYENFDEEEGYSGEMSAQDILDHPRVVGFSENFGGNDYYYTPIGVVVEEAGDIATNDDEDVETTDDPAISVGESSMLVNNKTWIRTFAKKMTEEGDSIITDNGDKPTPRGEPETNPKYDDYDWLNTMNPTLRDDVTGREIELWITEETNTWDDGTTTTFDYPNVMDVKTGETVQIDNGVDNTSTDASSGDTTQAATDGGTAAESGGGSGGDTESPDEPSADESGLPENVPDSLTTLLDFLARNADSADEISAQDVRDFAEDEVDDPDAVDWDAAATAAGDMV